MSTTKVGTSSPNRYTLRVVKKLRVDESTLHEDALRVCPTIRNAVHSMIRYTNGISFLCSSRLRIA